MSQRGPVYEWKDSQRQRLRLFYIVNTMTLEISNDKTGRVMSFEVQHPASLSRALGAIEKERVS